MRVVTEKKPLLPIFNQKIRLHFIHWVNVSSRSLDLERFTVYSTNCQYLNDVQLVQSSQHSPTPQPGHIAFCARERWIDYTRLRSLHYVHTSPSPYIGKGRFFVRNTTNNVGYVFDRGSYYAAFLNKQGEGPWGPLADDQPCPCPSLRANGYGNVFWSYSV